MFPINVNGETHRAESSPDKPLLWVLRDELGLKGTKYGCGVGVCGACVVLIDGEPNHACMVPLARVGDRKVVTIEGLSADHPVVQAWIAEQVPQCGYCQPAQMLSAAALIERRRSPTDADIDAAMSGVLCRCGTYARIRRAVHAASARKPGAPKPLRLPELLSDLPPDAGAAPNQWVWINSAGTVTLMVNHSEMGQGALTALAALAAEELDVEIEQVRTVFAPADKRYENGYWGGAQFTGGSSSIRGEWARLRKAAAKTRLRLTEAAARRWGVDASTPARAAPRAVAWCMLRAAGASHTANSPRRRRGSPCRAGRRSSSRTSSATSGGRCRVWIFPQCALGRRATASTSRCRERWSRS